MATQTKGRINISANVPEGLALAKKVYTKHLADGATSPLTDLDGVDWRVSGPKINTCLAKHEEAEALMRDAEAAYRDRDAIFAEITEINRVSKNMLKGKYTKNPKALGDWGYQIDDTPRAKKPQ